MENGVVLLAHGYGLEGDRLDTRGRLQVEAVSKLFSQKRISRVVFTAGKVFGYSVGLSEAMRRALLNRNPQIPWEAAVISDGPHLSTRGELRQFKLHVSESPFAGLAVLGTLTHMPRIRRNLERVFGPRSAEIKTWATEEILGLEAAFVRSYLSSPEEASLQRHERVLNAVDRIPWFGPLFLDLVTLLPFKYLFQQKALKMLEGD